MTNAPHPPPFSTVDDVLAAATAPASPSELRGEGAAMAAFRSEAQPVVGRQGRRILASKAALAAVGALGLLTVGSAAAATGSLPDAAQDKASEVLTKVGVDVPRGKGLATAPGQQKDKTAAEDKVAKDKAAKDKAKAEAPQGPDADKGSGHGATISSIAHDPNLTGAEKGAAVSNAASDGKSHAGENPGSPPSSTPVGPPSSLPGGPPASSPSDTAPGKTTSATAGQKAPRP